MRLFVLFAAFLTSPLPAQTPLCAEINALVQDSPAHWGISITTLDGTPLCQLDEAKLFRPASNAKLFTTAAALALLGPDRIFETKVVGDFDAKTGVVTGDLTLIGGGDANLDSGDLPWQAHPPKPAPAFAFKDLEDLAAQLVARGVKTITGNIVGDDTLFPYEPYPKGWELDDLVWGYGAPVSALTIADNQVKLTVTPGTNGHPAAVSLDQHGVPFYIVSGSVTTISAEQHESIQIERLPGSRAVSISGTIAPDAKPVEEELSIDDPAQYAAMAFRQILLAHTIQVKGSDRAQHTEQHRSDPTFLARLHAPLDAENAELQGNSVSYGKGLAYPPVLAVHRSSPMHGDVTFTLKDSQNLHAEVLLHMVGCVVPCPNGTTLEGARMVRTFLGRAGIALDDTILYDGSGLSSHDLVTPRSLTQLLVYAAKQPWFDTYKSALPVGGVDGTLNSRFIGENQPQLKGKVFAKTGTLGESRALSGYLTAASGHLLVFSILVDDHLPDSHADRTLMDQIVALAAAAN